MSLADITALLPALTPDELLNLRSRINALLQVTRDVQVKQGNYRPTRMAMECICEVLRDLGVDHVSYGTLVVMRVPSFPSKVADVMKFITQAHPTQTGRRALLCLGLKLLYHDMLRNDVPVSGRSVMNHFHRIPGVIDAAFPGYAARGLLHATVSRTLTAPAV